MQKDKIIFSKSFRQQYFTYEIVSSFMNALDRKMLPLKTLQCVERIDKRLNNIKNIICGNHMRLNPKDIKKYNRISNNCKNYFVTKLNEKVGTAFLNMMLCMIEDSRIESKNKKDKRLHNELNWLNKSLFTLYKHTDPELKEIDEMESSKNMLNSVYGFI